MLLQGLALFLFGISIVKADIQDLTALQWLEKMNHAMKTLNYQGTVVFMKNGQLDSMKYKHQVELGIEQERLISLNSPLREVMRKANEVSCIFKETSQKIINHHPIDSSFIINLPSDTAYLDKYYSFALAGNESIAMLPTQIVNIQPKDQFRYARKIWIDTQHFLPLKVEAYNLDGSILDQVVFTDIELDSAKEASSNEVDEKKLDVKHIHSHQAEPFENASFRLNNWPDGFKTLFFIRNSMQTPQTAVDHLLISDGLSSVSVYLEPVESQGMQGFNSLGSVNSFSRVINNYQITVLGEVPAKTVEFIASGIILR